MNIVIVSRRVPPARCGVGDHTIELASTLVQMGHHCSVLTGADQKYRAPHPNAAEVKVAATIPAWSGGACRTLQKELLRLGAEHVILQWVPSVYDPRGIAPVLASSFGDLRRHGIRFTTLVHEPWVAFDRWQHLVSGPIQRLQLGMLCAASDSIAVSTMAWERDLKAWFPWARTRTFWVPTASNIPVFPAPGGQRAARQLLGLPEQALVLGTFSPLGAGKGRDLIRAAWNTLAARDATVALLIVGITREEGADAFHDLAARDRVHFTGHLPASAVSHALQAVDLYLAPFVDGLSSRRASALAALAHGIPTVSTRGHLFEAQVFADSPLQITDYNEAQFVAAVDALSQDAKGRVALAETTRAFYQRTFGFENVARRLLHQPTA